MKKKYIFIMILVVLGIFILGIIATTLELGVSSIERNPDELRIVGGAQRIKPESGFDPITGGNYTMSETLLHSTLFKRSNNMSLVNDLATNYSISENGKKWIVNIRDDVRFHDNSSLTAKDVAFTYNKAKELGRCALDFSNMVNATAINDTVVEFTLNKSDSTFLAKLCLLGIVPSATYNENYGQNPIGSGPYKFVQWDKDQQVIFELNNDYYREKPKFKRLTIIFLESDAAFAAAKKGELDIVELPLSYSNESIENMTLYTWDSVDARGISLPYVPDTGKTNNGTPIGNNVTSNEAIRKALAYGIDRQSIIDGPLNGHGSKSFDGIGYQLPWSNKEAEIKDGDIEKAKSILKKDGWADSDGDGIIEKNGTKANFTVYYPAKDSTRQAIALSVSEQSKKFGIDIKVEGINFDEVEKFQHSNGILWAYGNLDPQFIYNRYHDSNAGKGKNNPTYYNNSVVNQHLDSALTATSQETSYKHWSLASWDGQTGTSPQGDAAWLWLVFVDYTCFVDKTLDISKNTSTIQPNGGNLFGNIYDWKRIT